MIKRILDLNASDIKNLNKEDILNSIKAAEGRTVMSEIIGKYPPILGDVSNVEVACSFGADIILLNMYDVENPVINGLEIQDDENFLRELKDIVGRIVGINLEPVDESKELFDEKIKISEGRLATVNNVKKVLDQGADFIVLTGNPKTGVTNEKIINTINNIRNELGENVLIIAGKMHSSGNDEEIINQKIVEEFIEAGADIILVPAPGTVPGITLQKITDITSYVHKKNKLIMTTIGTSQEGSDDYTIKQIAINSKMAGVDIHHIGDAGMSPGIATPENIMNYSISIKGKRHTYRRMAKSIKR
ncbi:haloacid dehalogenase-like hydrolase [Oceanotoga sp. DSM 15011]|nr:MULTISPECIES: haloacid dehalogenase-like hydrolase [Oceanotoga]MDN5342512.1 hypothetical protein [Oceanotoga sp.]MDO7977488.1 haloacid dehalogenase-like hydrolase [Oceanotoga teriensis]UYO99481.1 haloacid dehalogenase-like hydrolase [Oceanotoga sp. DSM 15011]